MDSNFVDIKKFSDEPTNLIFMPYHEERSSSFLRKLASLHYDTRRQVPENCVHSDGFKSLGYDSMTISAVSFVTHFIMEIFCGHNYENVLLSKLGVF